MGTTEEALHCNMGATVGGELCSLSQDLLMPVLWSEKSSSRRSV